MVFDNVYCPSESDIRKWVESGQSKWPTQDWDMYIIESKNERIAYEYASNPSCAHQDLFIHCLYFMVGEYMVWYPNDKQRLERINAILKMANQDKDPLILKWSHEASDVLANRKHFVKNYWIAHMFQEHPNKTPDTVAASRPPRLLP